MFGDSYNGKSVWLSGHTGFKGAWMAQWLHRLGADVHGFSVDVPTQPALCEQAELHRYVRGETGDIRHLAAVRKSLDAAKPDYVFHFAAQTVVRTSYAEPVETFAANVMGTIHVLEALRELGRPCSVVVVTTDKCYENRETDHAYTETDPLGGHDPYSASKAAAEIAVSSWQRSFLADSDIRVATARAGNVIGGGDWTKYQLVPDCIRALQASQTIDIRNPHATRPWQHVLEPLSGYLWLGATLSHPGLVGAARNDIASAFNFGPFDEANVTVGTLVDELLTHWPGRWQNTGDPAALHEAGLLMISIAKAAKVLQWTPTWDLKRAVAHTARFYHQLHLGEASARELCLADLAAYENTARNSGQPWAQSRP